MKALTPFPNEDLKLIKWEIVIALTSILIATGIYLGANYLDQASILELQMARAEFERARSSVELIEEEEGTIIEYIGRYQEITTEGGIMDLEDRLQFQETVAEIRENNSLFPISLSIGEQHSLQLQYAASVREPGGPINLNSSIIELNLPLLHEQDLGRLLRGIMDSPGLYQAQECNVTRQGGTNTNYFVLAQHLTAKCTIYRYTFDINPVIEPIRF